MSTWIVNKRIFLSSARSDIKNVLKFVLCVKGTVLSITVKNLESYFLSCEWSISKPCYISDIVQPKYAFIGWREAWVGWSSMCSCTQVMHAKNGHAHKSGV